MLGGLQVLESVLSIPEPHSSGTQESIINITTLEVQRFLCMHG